MKRCFYLVTVLLVAFVSLDGTTQTNYEQQVADWDAKRVEDLKSPNGWLNLAGLFWLKQGNNSFGSGKVDVKFPTKSLPLVAGSFLWNGKEVIMKVSRGLPITVDGKVVSSAVIFRVNGSKQPVVAYKNLQWTIIKREGKVGVRLRDLQHPALGSFKGIERFPVDTAYKVEATLVPSQSNLAITNVLGQTTGLPSPGKLVFSIKGQQFTLDALDGGPGELFIVFGDATSGNETYGAGRFLDVKYPGANGKTVVDFNLAYNPPCAFTEFATCPLPPKQNILPIAITAGEKDYKH